MNSSKQPQALWALWSFCSGMSALIYELLWMRRLGDLLGHSVFASQIVWAVFFGGMALGSVWATRWVGRIHPLRRYWQLEAGMGLFGLLSPWIVSGVGWLYYAVVPTPQATPGNLAVRSAMAVVFLLVPTVLMGATLPLLIQATQRERESAGQVAGWVYFWNTLGAAFGAVFAGFFLIRWCGVRNGIWCAAALNLLVAVWAFRHLRALPTGTLENKETQKATSPPSRAKSGQKQPGTQPWLWLILFGCSGFCAIAYEVLWSRALMSVLGNSVYSISILLGIYLLGLALGGGLWRWWKPKGGGFGEFQGLLGFLGIVSLWVLQALPQWESQSWFVGGVGSGWGREFAVVGVVLLLPSLCIGMMFPAMVETLANTGFMANTGGVSDGSVGKAAGWVSFATTLGGVLAPLVVGLFLMPQIGVARGVYWIAAFNIVLACVVFGWKREWAWWGVGCCVLGGILLLWVPSEHSLKSQKDGYHLLVKREGVAASLAVVEDQKGNRRLKLNQQFSMGGTQGSFGEARQGHLPRLLHPKAKDVLVLGVGSGNTIAAVSSYERTDRVVGVEIVPGVLPLLPYFANTNGGVWKRPHVRLLAEDARHVVAAWREHRFDLIVADLFHTYKAGVGGLYTREHYLRSKALLREDGCYFQWIPLYQLSRESLQVLIRTYLGVFPQVYGFLAYLNAKTPALGLLGGRKKFSFSAMKTAQRMKKMRPLLRRYGFDRAIDAFSMFVAHREILAAVSRDVPNNTEDRPWLELHLPFVRWSPSWPSLGQENLNWVLSWSKWSVTAANAPLTNPQKHETTQMPRTSEALRTLDGASLSRVFHVKEKAFGESLARRLEAVKFYLRSRLKLLAKQEKSSQTMLFSALQVDSSWNLPRQLVSNRASAFIQQGKLKRAEAFLIRVLKVLPSHEEAWALRGSIAYLQKRYDDSIAFYLSALREKADFPMARRNATLILLQRKRLKEAAEILLQSPKPSRYSKLFTRIALQLAAQKQAALLKRISAKLIVLQPAPPRAFELAAFAHILLHEYVAAIPLLQRAVQRNPRARHLQLWLGRLLFLQSQSTSRSPSASSQPSTRPSSRPATRSYTP